MTPQNFGADGVKGAEPLHGLRAFADQRLDAFAHFARRLVGEGDGENLPGACFPKRHNMRNAGRQRPCLARAGARKHQHRAIKRLDSGALLRIQPFEIARAVRQRSGAGGEAAFLRGVIVKFGQDGS